MKKIIVTSLALLSLNTFINSAQSETLHFQVGSEGKEGEEKVGNESSPKQFSLTQLITWTISQGETKPLNTESEGKDPTTENTESEGKDPTTENTESEGKDPTTENTESETEGKNQKPLLKAASESPLYKFSLTQPTGWTLSEGEVIFDFSTRIYNVSSSNVDPGGTGLYPNLGFIWGITDSTQVTIAYQQVDSGSPGRQGNFRAFRGTNAANADVTLGVKQKFWESKDRTVAVSGDFSLNFGGRVFNFNNAKGQTFNVTDSSVIPTLQFPVSLSIRALKLTISPTVGFFPSNSASYLHTLPINDPGSFGTTFGFGGSISYELSPQWILWADAFIPITGNNSINRDSGFPARTPAYDLGVRYLVNPQVAFDVFVSNRLGSTGALALTADRNLASIGFNLTFLPDFFAANKRYPNSFNSKLVGVNTPPVLAGFGLYERGPINPGRFNFDLIGSTNNVFTAFNYGFAKDLEVGIYLNYVFGNIDESEQGFSAQLRLLNQYEGAPFTLGLVGTISQTNEPFANFINNNTNTFQQRGLDKTIPFFTNTDSTNTGILYILTLSVPMNYQFSGGGAAVWLTPIIGYVQREGTEIAGFNAGGSIRIIPDLSVIGEIGANFTGKGNAFVDSQRGQEIPWAFGLRLNTANALGLDINPSVSLFVTNRLGFTPWQELRVRENNKVTVGVGLSIPF